MTEGRNHLVKRMLDAVGHPVLALRRLRFGPLDLEGLRVGKWRHLRHEEVRRVRSTATQAKKKRKAAGPRPKVVRPAPDAPDAVVSRPRVNEQRGVYITRPPRLDRDDDAPAAPRPPRPPRNRPSRRKEP